MLKLLVAGKPNNAALAVSLFLTMVTMVLWGVYMSGLTKTSGPMYNVYHGSAEIEHVNVTKILPISAPILQFLGGALLSKKLPEEKIFDSLKNMAQTEALAPMLQLLTNTTDSVGTLRELAAANSVKEKPIPPLEGILDLMKESRNSSAVVAGLSDVVKGGEMAKEANPNAKATDELFALTRIADKDTPKAAHALNVLAGIDMETRVKLGGIVSMLQYATNKTIFAESLDSFLNQNLSIDAAREVFKAYNTTLGTKTKATEVAGKIDEVANGLPEESRAAARALGNLLGQVLSPSGALGIFNKDSELLASSVAKPAAGALKDIMQSTSNETGAAEYIKDRAGQSNPAAETQVRGLDLILQNSDNPKQTYLKIMPLASVSEEAQKALPGLMGLLSYSTDQVKSMSSVVDLLKFGEKRPEILNPVLDVLYASVTVKELIPSQQIIDLTPTILSNFHVAARYRLGIFSLCRIYLNGTQKFCNNPHVVQNFDYRGILYDDLMNSDLAPYIKTLRVGPYDLYLEGKLLEKQPMYVPSIKAHLAFDIMGLISGLLLLLTLLATILGAFSLTVHSWVNRLLVIAFAGCCLLSATIIQIITAVVKWGAKIDNYGVVYHQGVAQVTLAWVAFVIAAIVVLIVWGTYFIGGRAQGVVNMEEGRASTSDEDFDKEKISRPHPARQDI
ncbi:AaceriAER090Wp [[Ashbya] aceris (nom. inval.)]|nr:AaceriAER090Wp [[Ashbya] aceris (nom. inval.)]